MLTTERQAKYASYVLHTGTYIRLILQHSIPEHLNYFHGTYKQSKQRIDKTFVVCQTYTVITFKGFFSKSLPLQRATRVLQLVIKGRSHNGVLGEP